MSQVPKDPVMLMSYLNTQLRDHYSTWEECCKSLNLEKEQIEKTLKQIDYVYDPERNQFI